MNKNNNKEQKQQKQLRSLAKFPENPAAVAVRVSPVTIHTTHASAAMKPSCAATNMPSAVSAAAGDGAECATVVVIGAGAAGIAAARRLESGLAGHATASVVVLEARQRVGGRVCTVPFLGEAIDLGASWIHQWCPQNPLQRVVRETGTALVSPRGGRWQTFDAVTGTNVTDDMHSVRYVGGQCRSSMRAARATLLRGRDQERRRSGGEGAATACPQDASAASGFEEVASQWIETGRVGDKLVVTPHTNDAAARSRLLRWHLNRTEQYEGAGFNEMSLLHWNAGGELPGGNAVPCGGYGALLTKYAAPLRDVRLRHEVVAVEARWGRGCLVTCVDHSVQPPRRYSIACGYVRAVWSLVVPSH